MPLDHTTTEILKIVIRAKDESEATLRQSAKRVEGMRSHLGGLGQGMLTAGLGIGGAIAAVAGGALKAASDFESTMSGVAAVSGATAGQMKSMSALAIQLGKDTSFSASDAGKGMEELVKGGVSIADIMNGAAKATLNLAAAGGVDLPTAAEIAANAANTFGISGKQMAHVADMIAGAANASSLDVTDFKFSMAAAGAVAHTVGLSFDDLSVAIAELAAAGMKGSDAGTSLKTLFINLSPQTDKAAAMMQKLGIMTKHGANAFFDQHGHIKSLAQIQGVLHKALSGLTKEQQINALHVMFGTDAMRAAATLANQGAAGYEKMATAMGKVTAASVAAKKLDNVKGAMEQLKGSLQTLAITIGLPQLGSLKTFLQALTGIVNKGIEFAQRLGPGFFKTAFAIAGIASAALAAGGAIAMLVAVMNPIGLAIAAIVAGVGLLSAAWASDFGHIREITASVLAQLRPVFLGLLAAAQAAWAGIQTAVRVAWAHIGPDIAAAIAVVLRFAHHILPTIGPAARNVFAFVQSVLHVFASAWGASWDGVALALRGVWDVIKGVVQVAWSLVSGIISVGLDVISGKWGRIWGDIKTMFKGIWDGLVSIVKGTLKELIGAVQALLDGALGAVGAFFPRFADAGKQLIDGLIDGIKSKVKGVTDAVGGVVGGAIHHAKALLHIKSPSGVFRELGRQTMAGMALGLLSGAPAVNAAAAGAGGQAGEHWVRGYHVAAHMIAGHTTRAGVYVRPHMVRAHEVAGHWAHNPPHAPSVAAGGGAASAAAVRAGVQLVALVSRGGSPLEPLPVTIVSAAGRAATLAGGAVAVAPASAAALGAAQESGGARGAGGTWGPVPASPRSRLTFGPHPHLVPASMHVEVHVHDGAVHVNAGGGLNPASAHIGELVGQAIASSLEDLAQTQLRSTVPARPTLPGAI